MPRCTSERTADGPRDPVPADCKTELAAQIELGTLLEQVTAGRQPESGATVAELLDQYVQVAEWDVSTRPGFDGYIRRTIKPALGNMQVRKVRGPVLDMFYAWLKICGDLACNGRPFTEHRNVPMLKADPVDRLPELCAFQDPRMSTLQNAFSVLADEGVLVVRQERTAVVAGDPPGRGEPGRRPWRPGPGPRLQAVRMPAACMQADESEHDPANPQHPVGRLRRGTGTLYGR